MTGQDRDGNTTKTSEQTNRDTPGAGQLGAVHGRPGAAESLGDAGQQEGAPNAEITGVRRRSQPQDHWVATWVCCRRSSQKFRDALSGSRNDSAAQRRNR